MATATTEKGFYPRINEAVWWKLRKSFRDRLPGVVDLGYLRGVLGYNESSARTLIPHLKRVGLIDDDGKPTERANRWRNDQQYSSVCQEIVESVYPQGLRDAFHDPSSQRDAVADWIAHVTRSGADTAQGFAKFYLMLLQADSTAAESSSAAGKMPKATKREATSARGRAGRAATSASRVPGAQATESDRGEQPHHAGQNQRSRSFAPSVHLDFQIHITPDSSPEQVDHIFASMAKHLRSLLTEAGE